MLKNCRFLHFFGVDLQCGILDHLFSFRTCDRVVGPS